MTKTEYCALADQLAKEAGVENGIHGSFLLHRDRLWSTVSHFGLWDVKGKDVLEIGAFYAYTPFVFKANGNRVTVLEGPDPVVFPLKDLYARRGIDIVWLDLGEVFGNADLSKHRLAFDDDAFDVITCWETMEHFNFNPVGFVKEVRRVLRPGGIATLTVPNRAKLDYRFKMAVGRPHGEPVGSYYEYYNYGGKFMGWHWREYTLREFVELFEKAGFQIVEASHLTAFQNRPHESPLRKAKQALARLACAVVPASGTNCVLTVRK
jgi:SAM-dependent methyltransferase